MTAPCRGGPIDGGQLTTSRRQAVPMRSADGYGLYVLTYHWNSSDWYWQWQPHGAQTS